MNSLRNIIRNILAIMPSAVGANPCVRPYLPGRHRGLPLQHIPKTGNLFFKKSLTKYPSLLAVGITVFLLSACAETRQELWSDVTTFKNELKEELTVWNKTKGYKGIQFPATEKVVPTFQDHQVPVSCRVFAHLLVSIPAGYTGKSLAQTVETEAMRRGADMLLIGGTRQAEDDTGPVFSYYGPVTPYKCRDNWDGWKFAYEDWVNQGEWVEMGYNEWGNLDVRFNAPLIIQAAFLRCPN